MASVWALMTAMEVQSGVSMLIGKPNTFCLELPTTPSGNRYFVFKRFYFECFSVKLKCEVLLWFDEFFSNVIFFRFLGFGMWAMESCWIVWIPNLQWELASFPTQAIKSHSLPTRIWANLVSYTLSMSTISGLDRRIPWLPFLSLPKVPKWLH